MGESLGLGKKSSGPETDTETWSWFRLPIPKPGFGRTLVWDKNYNENYKAVQSFLHSKNSASDLPSITYNFTIGPFYLAVASF